MPKQVIEWAINISGNAARQIQGLSKAAASMRSAVNAGGQALGMASAAALTAGAAFKGFADELTGIVDKMNTLAEGTGFAVETVNGMRLAAAAAGKELNEFFPKDLPKRMFEATKEGTRQEQAFKKLGVEVTDASGKLRSVDNVFRDLLDSLVTHEDRTEASGIAMQLMGDKGQALFTAFANGSKDLDKFNALAEEFAIDVSADAIASSNAWINSNAQLSLAFENVKQSIWDAFGSSASSLLTNFSVGLVFLTEKVKNLAKVVKREMTLEEAHEEAMASAKRFYEAPVAERSSEFVSTGTGVGSGGGTGRVRVPRPARSSTRSTDEETKAAKTWAELVGGVVGEETNKQSTMLRNEFGSWTPLFQDANALMVQQNSILESMADAIGGGILGGNGAALIGQFIGPMLGPVAGIFGFILEDALTGISRLLGMDTGPDEAMSLPSFEESKGLGEFFFGKRRPAQMNRGTPYVERTSLAVLHRGERVMTRDENAMYSSRGGPMGGGRPITVNVHGVRDARELSERLQRELGSYGLNLSLAALE